MLALKSALERIQGTSSFSYSSLRDSFSESPLSRSSSSSSSTSPDLGRLSSTPQYPTKRRHHGHPAVWIIVGFVTSTLVFAIIFPRTILVKQYQSKESTCVSLEEFSQRGGISLGPPKMVLTGVGKNGVPGPKELLSPQAPAASLFQGLRKDLRYLTADSWSGEVGQLLSAFSLIYLAQETQRVAILPSVWYDGEHYGTSSVRMGDLFDLDKFRKQTGTLFVEWSDVKDYKSKRAKKDELGCLFSWNGFADGRSYNDYKISTSAWSIKRPYGFASNSVEGLVLSDLDVPGRIELLRQAAIETNRPLPGNLEEGNQLMCYTNLWGVSKAGTSSPGTFWNQDYKAFDGLQSEQGGMINLLHPALRGVHPEWWAAGRYIDFTPAVWEVAILAVQKTLNLVEGQALPNLLTIHVRRGDFASWCPSGGGCVAPIERYKAAVDEMKSELPTDTIVLVTTDDTSSEFHSSLRKVGWYAVNHAEIGTASLLEERYGESSGWWDSAVDQAILSVGKGFIGTLDSQVSLVSALRVASWNNGITSFVTRPH